MRIIFKILLGLIGLYLILSIATYLYERHKFGSYEDYAKRQNYITDSLRKETAKSTSFLSDMFDSGSCSLSLDTIANANNLPVKIFLPCTWELNYDSAAPKSLIAQYSHEVQDSFLIGLSLSISNMHKQLNSQDIEKLRRKDFLLTIGHLYGSFVSSKNININGIPCCEMVLYNNQKGLINYYDYYDIYLLYYKNSIVIAAYLLRSLNENRAIDMFAKYKPLFKRLAYKTEFN